MSTTQGTRALRNRMTHLGKRIFEYSIAFSAVVKGFLLKSYSRGVNLSDLHAPILADSKKNEWKIVDNGLTREGCLPCHRWSLIGNRPDKPIQPKELLSQFIQRAVS